MSFDKGFLEHFVERVIKESELRDERLAEEFLRKKRQDARVLCCKMGIALMSFAHKCVVWFFKILIVWLYGIGLFSIFLLFVYLPALLLSWTSLELCQPRMFANVMMQPYPSVCQYILGPTKPCQIS